MPFVQAGDFQIHYVIEGQGEPLVLLHGLGNNSRSWKNQVESLKEHFTVIAWDAPGYGKSSDQKVEFQSFIEFADVLKQFIDALSYETVFLLGHSMGSGISVEFCAKYPEKVKGLILASSTRGGFALTEEENKKRRDDRYYMIDNLNPKEIAKLRVPNLLSPYASEEVKKEAEEIMAQIRPSGYRSVANCLYHFNPMNALKNIAVRTLIICGELDRVTPVSESQFFHEQLSYSTMYIIPKTGHLCYQEDPESFNEIIFTYVKEIKVI
ncbi:alpha/beta fold hydrolase [Alkalihalobacillus sp. BA299]|uniref:alpha/beta fold hydrolase n=1 Tax=Alkalihalobacillus sp. BA299 TaxID=2815938 RepID=UPI001ADC9F1F|nr:alpha/beta hydrolase [Alkalihalobacillus sp. BA299]